MGSSDPARRGWHMSEMFEAMERGEFRALYVLGENPLQSEADQAQTRHRLEGLDLLIVQDIFLTATAAMADVVFPAAAGWCESEGTVTNSERRVQRVRKALDPPGGARDDLNILFDLARRMGHDWGEPDAEKIWDEVRALSPPHAGMSYARSGGDGRACSGPVMTTTIRASYSCTAGSGSSRLNGPKVAFQPVEHDPPVERLTDEFPLRLTTGRRLDEYNTGVQTSGYASPLRRGESLDISPEDAGRLGVENGEVVRVSSRRGGIEVPVRIDEGLRPGLTFMTPHFQDEVATNILTIDATDPRSGTAEFKAAAIRVERLGAT